jgi:hypothetical protein
MRIWAFEAFRTADRRARDVPSADRHWRVCLRPHVSDVRGYQPLRAMGWLASRDGADPTKNTRRRDRRPAGVSALRTLVMAYGEPMYRCWMPTASIASISSSRHSSPVDYKVCSSKTSRPNTRIASKMPTVLRVLKVLRVERVRVRRRPTPLPVQHLQHRQHLLLIHATVSALAPS